jgi:hypothetical protein
MSIPAPPVPKKKRLVDPDWARLETSDAASRAMRAAPVWMSTNLFSSKLNMLPAYALERPSARFVDTAVD